MGVRIVGRLTLPRLTIKSFAPDTIYIHIAGTLSTRKKTQENVGNFRKHVARLRITQHFLMTAINIEKL